MRHWWLVICLMISVSGRAEDWNIRTVFQHMPDSLIPCLSENNRLDMIDFNDSKMKAEVTNILHGSSEMLALTEDSLSIRVSDALLVNMLLLVPINMVDSCRQVICMVQTFGTDSVSLDSKIDYYTPQWQKLDIIPQLSPADKRRVDALDVQTILKWEESYLKKD